MGQLVIVHRHEESASGRLVVVESGLFDPDATDNPSWVDEALDAVASASDGPPPTSGTGSGKSAWIDYAAGKDVEIDDSMTRDEIIAACKAAGVPTE